MSTTPLEWQAPEFEHREKHVSWYWISIIIAVACVGIAVWQSNFLFVLFLVVAEVLVLVWASREPRMITFTLNEHHFVINNHSSYATQEIESFSLDRRSEGLSTIIFKFRNKFKPTLSAHITNDRLSDVEQKLQEMFPETIYEPSLLDSIERILGF